MTIKAGHSSDQPFRVNCLFNHYCFFFFFFFFFILVDYQTGLRENNKLLETGASLGCTWHTLKLSILSREATLSELFFYLLLKGICSRMKGQILFFLRRILFSRGLAYRLKTNRQLQKSPPPHLYWKKLLSAPSHFILKYLAVNQLTTS